MEEETVQCREGALPGQLPTIGGIYCLLGAEPGGHCKETCEMGSEAGIIEGPPGSVPSILEASQEGTGKAYSSRADPEEGST